MLAEAAGLAREVEWQGQCGIVGEGWDRASEGISDRVTSTVMVESGGSLGNWGQVRIIKG